MHIFQTPIARHLMTLPGGNMLRLHLASFVAAKFDLSLFAEARMELPVAIGRSVRKRQAEFFFGRLAARSALRDLGIEVGNIPVGTSREPVWPPGTVGSISHVDGLAGAVASASAHHGGLGIDLERTAHGQSQSALRDSAIDRWELARLSTVVGALSLDELVTLVFSAKESLYKAAYCTVGRFFGFEAARVEAVDVLRGIIVLVLTEELHPDFPRGRRCNIAFLRLDPETFLTVFDVPRVMRPPRIER
jgi:enterobactin synthetase component D